MEGSAEKRPREESEGEVPPEALAANDEFFGGEIALKGLGEEFIKRKFALDAVRKNIEKDPNSLFINSLRFTEEDLAFDCKRIATQIQELGPKNALDTEKYFRAVDDLVERVGKERAQKKAP